MVTVVNDGSPVQLVCRINSKISHKNDVLHIEWWDGDNKMEGGDMQFGDRLTLTITPDMTNHGKVYSCKIMYQPPPDFVIVPTQAINNIHTGCNVTIQVRGKGMFNIHLY